MTIERKDPGMCRRVVVLVSLAVATSLALLASPPASAQTVRDPAKIMGPGECGECHKLTTEIWRNTRHHATFRDMPRNKKGIEIAKLMGLRRIKKGSVCLGCHFTSKIKDGKPEPIAGISCESCHAAGADYMKVHGSFSGHKKKEQESPEEAKVRWRKSEDAGMIRPHDLQRLAQNCYSCHVVPQEKLVNVGGHPAGSAFEMVAWSQGEVRHNVWYNEGKANPPADLNRRRLMFIVGMAVELEISLRAVGKATERASYAVSMAKRANRARKRFAKATELVGRPPEMVAIAKAAKAAGLKLNNDAELTAAADEIEALTKTLASKYDGSRFGAIDKALPPENKWKGTPKPAR